MRSRRPATWCPASAALDARHDRSSPRTFRGGASGDETTLQAAALTWF